MLVIILLLIIFLLYIFLYGGALLYVKIEKSDYQYIFWGLYVVTILTVLEIIFCIHLYVNYRSKDGELGPKGYQGEPGPKGDKGKCDRSNCKKDLLVIMIRDILNKYFEDNNKDGRVNKNQLESINTEVIRISNEDINNIKQEHLRKIYDRITEYVEINDPEPDNFNNLIPNIVGFINTT
jgi:hypothetical protein